MYIVKNIDDPNFRKHKFAVVRFEVESDDSSKRKYSYYKSYDKVEEAFVVANTLGDGLVVETCDIAEPAVEISKTERESHKIVVANRIINDILVAAYNRSKNLRFGQAVYIAALSRVPSIVSDIQATKDDCFYVDERVPAFLERISKSIIDNKSK